MVVVHVFISSIWEEKQANLCEFEASLVYRASSRTARVVTQRNSVSKKKKNPRQHGKS